MRGMRYGKYTRGLFIPRTQTTGQRSVRTVRPTAPPGWKSTLKIDQDIANGDAGKRMSDTINLHLTFGKREDIIEKWIAFSLADGSSDGQMYDSKVDAIRHQVHETQCYYVSFRGLSPGGVNPYECTVMLQFQRDAYKAGLRLVDPDTRSGGPQAMMTAEDYDWYTNAMPRTQIQWGQGNG